MLIPIPTTWRACRFTEEQWWPDTVADIRLQHGGPDIAGYLADANVEGEMRVLALGDTHGVIQGCG